MAVPFRRLLLALGVLAGVVEMLAAESGPPLRAPVHPRHNVEEFSPVEARYVRFTIDETAGSQPGLDELEIYGPADPQKNLALAANGAKATASGTLSEYRIHALSHINDGIYGNAHSWISDRINGSWVMIELPQPAVIQRVIWSRDREGKFIDRLPTKYRIETALAPGAWQVVASSEDRAPLTGIFDSNPSQRGFAASYAPSGSEPATGPSASNREYVLQTWQTVQGLPSNTVTSILQTRDGWLWIGTTHGLARFDGREFTPLGESEGLPSLSVTCLCEDRDGTLWVGTNGGGLARRARGAARIQPFHELAEKAIFSLTVDPRGAVWIGSSGGLHEYSEGVLTQRSEERVARVASAHEGGPWMLIDGTLYRWDGARVISPELEIEPSRFSSLRGLAVDSAGSVWFGGANGYIGCLRKGAV
ncbi:MAG: two-component regulator propeller domain-containing protein, partial [Chthoniobacteraceae bacterium]